MHDSPTEHARSRRLTDLHRQIEDCVYLLTRPTTNAERAQFKHLLEEITQEVNALQRSTPRRLWDRSWMGVRPATESAAGAPQAS